MPPNLTSQLMSASPGVGDARGKDSEPLVSGRSSKCRHLSGTPVSSGHRSTSAAASDLVQGALGLSSSDISPTNSRTACWVSSPRPQKSCSQNFCHYLSDGCLIHTLSCCSASVMCRLLRVCKTLNRLSLTELLWKNLCCRYYWNDLKYFQALRPRSCETPLWRGMFRFLVNMRLKLYFVTGPFSQQTRLVTNSGCTIGRSRSNDICLLLDQMVSRKHVRVSFHSHHFVICDSGGVNGTYLNDACLPQFVNSNLHLGDVVELGWTRFVVQPDRGDPALEWDEDPEFLF